MQQLQALKTDMWHVKHALKAIKTIRQQSNDCNAVSEA